FTLGDAMARTKGSKNKSKVAPVTEEVEGQADEAVVRVASTKDVTNPKQKKLLDQIAALQAEKAALEAKVEKTQQEKEALEAVQAQGAVFGIQAEERLTGKKVMVKRLKNMKVVGFENGREILRPVFNDVAFYHGAVYEVDVDTLKTLKDIVYRCWDHDRQIHGDKNESAYRRCNVDFNPRNVLRGGGQ